MGGLGQNVIPTGSTQSEASLRLRSGPRDRIPEGWFGVGRGLPWRVPIRIPSVRHILVQRPQARLHSWSRTHGLPCGDPTLSGNPLPVVPSAGEGFTRSPGRSLSEGALSPWLNDPTSGATVGLDFDVVSDPIPGAEHMQDPVSADPGGGVSA